MLRTLRNHLLQIRPNYNVETVTTVLVRNSPVAARCSGGSSTPGSTRSGEADRAERDRAAEDALREGVRGRREPLRRRDPEGRREPGARRRADELLPAPRAAGHLDQGRHARRSRGWSRRGRSSRSTSTRGSSRASTCAAGRSRAAGIRWSDRHDDFRTEILGLMKTQMVKNSVIVPVGSKGGFVLKGDVPPRPALDSYLIDRYREFVLGPPRRDRQPGGRRGRSIRRRSSATTSPTRTSSSPPTRERRISRTRPTACRRNTASGWATRSRRAAATATTTRRRASPRAGRGSA